MADTNHGSADAYAKSGFANKMGWGSRPALLLIDVCVAYWTPDSPLNIISDSNPAGAASLDVMRRLLTAAREAGLPVLWTAVEYEDPQMRDAGLFWKKSKALSLWQKGDTRGFDKTAEGLEPKVEDGEVIVKKKYPSGFFGTTLATELTVRDVHCLLPFFDTLPFRAVAGAFPILGLLRRAL